MQQFAPIFTITPGIVQALMRIEGDKEAIGGLPMTPALLQSLRESACLLTTHYSTQIEGNRLTQAQVREIMEGGGRFPGRERDEAEVRNYLRALAYVEEQSRGQATLTQALIRRIHGWAYKGKGAATPYRDGQNVIRDSLTNAIVYMPPQARDVPPLMAQLVQWINARIEEKQLPVPIVAALAHYQFATIHPYYDGNGRTARLVTTFILHRYGYGLKGIYALESYYARDLAGYYGALTVGEGHNYYVGNRASADVTAFIDYFVRGMAEAFSRVHAQAQREQSAGHPDQSALLRKLSPAQRQALALFKRQSETTAKAVAALFKVSPRQGARYCAQWTAEGFLTPAVSAKRSRRYKLSPPYEGLFG